MLNQKLRKQIRLGARSSRRRKLVLALALILSLVMAGGALAQWSGLFPVTQRLRQKEKEMAPAALTQSTPSKEYVYVGDRLLAVEEQ